MSPFHNWTIALLGPAGLLSRFAPYGFTLAFLVPTLTQLGFVFHTRILGRFAYLRFVLGARIKLHDCVECDPVKSRLLWLKYADRPTLSYNIDEKRERAN